MAELQPEQAAFLLSSVYLPDTSSEHATTKRIIEAIPADRSDYRPDEVSKTAMELAWHIVVTEMRFLDSVAAGAFDLSPRPKPETIQTPQDLSVWYAEHFRLRVEALLAASPEQLAKVIDFRGLFQLPAVKFLGFTLHHTIHHRGQLSQYLRPMGAKVPAIYGESYDSAQARKPAGG